MSLKTIRFFLVRFKRSSVAEIFHRVQELFLLFFIWNFPVIVKKIYDCPDVDPDAIKKLQLSSVPGDIGPEIISKLLEGQLFCLGQEQSDLIRFERKHRNTFFSKIRCQVGDPDIRAVWETGRLQHLMMLLVFLKSEESESRKNEIQEFVKKNLLRWLNENPFPYGPHYISVMECGLRIPVFLQAIHGLGCLGKEELNKIYQSIYQHGWLIRKRLSLYSSLGNHTVTECLGLIMAGTVFRNDKQGREWLQTGIHLLEQESEHQILSDGGPAEQSLNYHRFVLDLYRLAVGFLEANKLHDCSRLGNSLKQGEVFFSVFQGPDGKVPSIGDSDDGYAVAPGLHPVRDAHVTHGPGATTFPVSGCTVIRGENGLLFTYDHGPLGMEPLYNHGHADGLSVTLSLDEKDFLVDPGTYMYNGNPTLRSYFKGTSAHNTVCIDREDQAVQLTGFIWDKPYGVEWKREVNFGGYEVIIASHDGYSRLSRSVIHQRRIVYGQSGIFMIEDVFKGAGRHNFALNFHLHPNVLVKQDGPWYYLENNGRKLCMQIVEGQFEQVRGRKDPLLGWFSPAYGVLEETTTLHLERDGDPEEIRFVTIIAIGSMPNQETLSMFMERL